MGDSLQRIEDIDEVLNGLDEVTQRFNEIKENLPSFKILKDKIKERIDYTTDEFGLLSKDGSNNDLIPLQAALKSLNDAIKEKSSKKESWGINGEIDKTCDTFGEGEFIIHPKYCKPIDRTWILDSNEQDIIDSARIVSAIVDIVSKLKDTDVFPGKITILKAAYDNYLDSYITILRFLKTTITSLIGNIKEIAGDGKIFSFVNGKFIGTNIKIILKYLKYSLGKDLYTVGLCLIIVGCSLILSISSTILLIAIVNFSLKNIQNDPDPQVIPFQNNAISMPNY